MYNITKENHQKFFFNDETAEFLARFKYDKNIDEPSVLYFNKELYYNNGYELKITDDYGNSIEDVIINKKQENYIHFKITKDIDSDLIVKVTLIPL